MPPRRNKEKFQRLTEFEQGRIIGLREGGFSCHAIGAHVQRTTSKTGIGRQKVVSVCDDWHLLRMVVNDRTALFTHLEVRWCTAIVGFVNWSSLLHRGLRARVPLYRIPLSVDHHRRMRLQWGHEHRT
ncbi:transposable element Tcb1 transposase [Trichonephila clavipes]|nr:transposable element Tcb1 transposase [Trichonephila clavipes]